MHNSWRRIGTGFNPGRRPRHPFCPLGARPAGANCQKSIARSNGSDRAGDRRNPKCALCAGGFEFVAERRPGRFFCSGDGCFAEAWCGDRAERCSKRPAACQHRIALGCFAPRGRDFPSLRSRPSDFAIRKSDRHQCVFRKAFQYIHGCGGGSGSWRRSIAFSSVRQHPLAKICRYSGKFWTFAPIRSSVFSTVKGPLWRARRGKTNTRASERKWCRENAKRRRWHQSRRRGVPWVQSLFRFARLDHLHGHAGPRAGGADEASRDQRRGRRQRAFCCRHRIGLHVGRPDIAVERSARHRSQSDTRRVRNSV